MEKIQEKLALIDADIKALQERAQQLAEATKSNEAQFLQLLGARNILISILTEGAENDSKGEVAEEAPEA